MILLHRISTHLAMFATTLMPFSLARSNTGFRPAPVPIPLTLVGEFSCPALLRFFPHQEWTDDLCRYCRIGVQRLMPAEGCRVNIVLHRTHLSPNPSSHPPGESSRLHMVRVVFRLASLWHEVHCPPCSLPQFLLHAAEYSTLNSWSDAQSPIIHPPTTARWTPTCVGIRISRDFTPYRDEKLGVAVACSLLVDFGQLEEEGPLISVLISEINWGSVVLCVSRGRPVQVTTPF